MITLWILGAIFNIVLVIHGAAERDGFMVVVGVVAVVGCVIAIFEEIHERSSEE